MKAKLSKKDVEDIMELVKKGKTQTEISKIYNVSQGTISRNIKYYKYRLTVMEYEKFRREL